MSEVTVENGEQAEVPDYPIVPCEVYACHSGNGVYPMYIPGEVSSHVWDEAEGRYRWQRISTLVENYVEFTDPDSWARVVWLVHPDNCRDECIWCESPVYRPAISDSEMRAFRNMSGYLCPDCISSAYTCESYDCGTFVHEDSVYSLSGDYYCESCYYDVTTACEYCDERYHVDDDPQCGCTSGMIQPYSEKFRPVVVRYVDDAGRLQTEQFRRLPARRVNDIFLGLEFEMENMTRRGTQDIAELFRDAYDENVLMLKHDGSISDGFELVTQPHTLDAFMGHFPWDLIHEAQQRGMRGWDVGHREIGIHIHINRKAFYRNPEHYRYNASPHLMSFMHFIYKNVPSVKRIAGRNVGYGHMDESYATQAFRCSLRGRSQDSRTQAVNCMNDETIELRMFRSTMRVERVQAYLQFAEAAVRYTQTDRVNKMRDRWNFRQFASWCSVQERYTQLNKLIDETNAVDYARPIDRTTQIQLTDNDNQFVPSDEDINN